MQAKSLPTRGGGGGPIRYADAPNKQVCVCAALAHVCSQCLLQPPCVDDDHDLSEALRGRHAAGDKLQNPNACVLLLRCLLLFSCSWPCGTSCGGMMACTTLSQCWMAPWSPSCSPQ
jgi:hypothetical protein